MERKALARKRQHVSVKTRTRTLTEDNQPGESRVVEEYGAPGEIRTPDLLIRSQSLYPAELRAHWVEARNLDRLTGIKRWRNAV
jgi:hypothetical protein